MFLIQKYIRRKRLCNNSCILSWVKILLRLYFTRNVNCFFERVYIALANICSADNAFCFIDGNTARGKNNKKTSQRCSEEQNFPYQLWKSSFLNFKLIKLNLAWLVQYWLLKVLFILYFLILKILKFWKSRYFLWNNLSLSLNKFVNQKILYLYFYCLLTRFIEAISKKRLSIAFKTIKTKFRIYKKVDLYNVIHTISIFLLLQSQKNDYLNYTFTCRPSTRHFAM